MDDKDLERRAFAAWHRFYPDASSEPPARAKVVVVDSLKYVVLESRVYTVAVYRVRNDGQLKKLKRFPSWVDGADDSPESTLFVIGPQHMNRVKIDLAKDPVKQLNSMQVGSPDPLRIVYTYPGTEALKKALHKRFSLFRAPLGWFDFGAASAKVLVQQAIKEIEATA